MTSSRPPGATIASVRTDLLDYDLPPELVATRPAVPRDAARLMIASRDGGPFVHRGLRDLPAALRDGDLLVVNDTAVLPARLEGRREPGGGRVAGLFLEAIAPDRWRLMLRSNRPLRPGAMVTLLDADEAAAGTLRLDERDGAAWRATILVGEAATLLDRAGRTPLPPYVLRARAERGDSCAESEDRAWYRTLYARESARHSVAAPTAGLHFTRALLAALDAAGIRRTSVTLHVGAGTFRPIATERLEEHPMHVERFEVPAAALREILDCRARGGRVVAVGTTSLRALESLPDPLPDPRAGAIVGATDLLVAPGHRFRVVEGLMTNFHLPRSTLLALVAGLLGLERMQAAYAEAVRERYRFYSYGDAMLVL